MGLLIIVIVFFWLQDLWIGGLITCVVFVYVVYYDVGFLGFLYCGLSVCYCAWFVKLMALFDFDIGVFACSTCIKFLKLIPIIYNLVAASPPFFSIMEQWFTRMILAWILCVLALFVLFSTTVSFAFEDRFSRFAHYYWLIIFKIF